MSDGNLEIPEEIEFNNWHPGDFHIAVAQPTDFGRNYRVGIYAHTDNGVYAAREVKLEKLPDHDQAFIGEAMCMNKEQATELMNSLWDAGIRPAKAKLKELQVGALQDHLKDMKNLSFNELLPMLRKALGMQVTKKDLSQELEKLTKSIDREKDRDNQEGL